MHIQSQHHTEQNNPHPVPTYIQRPFTAITTDYEFIGETLTTPKQSSTTRIYFNNINGISNCHQYEGFKQVLDNLVTIQSDIICLAEHNLAVDQSRTRYTLNETIRRQLPNCRIISSTSEIQSPSQYKPGGCLQIIANTIHSRITTQGSDKFGRWTFVGLSTKHRSMIFIITAYKPCKNNHQSGPFTVYNQQWTMLRALNIPQPEPRRQFDEDFVHFLQQLREKSHRLIVLGDFNEPNNQSKLLQEIRRMGLVDMVSSRHYNIPSFRSCNKGTNVIDYAFCSSSLLSSLQSSMYEPFMFTTTSDHRGIIVDFDTKTLLGKQELLVSPDKRGLNANNPVQVDKFIKELRTYWKKYNISDRIQEAMNDTSSTSKFRKTINCIDNDITTAMLKAERKVRKGDRPPWSPALKQASLLVKYYKLLRRQLILKTDMSTVIKHTKQQLETPPHEPRNRQEYQTLLRKAQKSLRKIRQKAQQHRDQHLDILLKRYGIMEDEKMQKIIRRLIQAEATKRCYKKLKWITKPPQPGVTFVERTTGDGTTETLYNRATLEQAILFRNQQHFNQCKGTPFTVGKLRTLNWAADSPTADEILQGSTHTINQLSNDRLTQYVLHQCKTMGQPISDHVTTEDLKQLFKKWRESTTTSQSGRHLGIYRAIFLNQQSTATHHNIDNDLAKMINMLIQHGIGLERWRNVTNMMIHKLDGSYNINKLRVIHLFEADYNGLIGILFNRRVLYQAEHSKLINDNQWGGRPHRQADDALMLKELTYNITVATKTTLATFDNDATGCFDRVPCTVAMLSSRRLGATKNMCRMQADTLQHIRHKLRTAFGTSSHSYTSNDDCEIHGQGQGSRAGPPTWVFVSSLLLDCMQQLANGLHFTCPDQTTHHCRTNDAFVDDVTGYANKFLHELKGNNVLHEVISTMQKDATLWNNLLRISGGKLALPKCLYYIIGWEWKQGKASMIHANNIQPKIILNDGTQDTAIRHLNYDQAHRTLGQLKVPNGNQSPQLSYMISKSTKWLTTIQAASLSKQEAEAAYKMIWFPSLSYGMGTTNLSFDELNQIQKPIINHILPALGYNRHLPRAVVYGSSAFGGLNLKHLYIEQGTKHVLNFIKYYRSGGSVGKLLKISLQWLRLIAGFSYCPLSRPQTDYHHIEDKWYQTTLRFLYECGASIETEPAPSVLCREHDSCLMEDFLLLQPTPCELKTLNQIRLFLRVTTLSDICTPTGDEIDRQCWEGTQCKTSTRLWPRMEKPPPRAWSIWRKYISSCYLIEPSTTRKKLEELHLSYPLGPWLRPSKIVWPYYINPFSLTIYHHHQNIDVLSPCNNTRTLLTYRPTGRTNYIPQSTIPIACTSTPHGITVLKRNLPRPLVLPTTKPDNFNDYIHSLEHWEKALLLNTHFEQSFDELSSTLTTPTIIASDGSVKDARGSFGWVIATLTGQILAKGSGIAFGYEVTSFRSEAYGILAPLRLLYRLQLYFQQPLHNRPLTWYCDSESLLKRINSNLLDTPNPNRYKLADNDLETAIVNTIPLMSTILHRHHIRSHQHDHTPLHQLPLPQQLNRIADSLASRVHQEQNPPSNRVPIITIAGCQLHTRQGTITRSFTRTLHNAYTYQQTRRHICNRLGIHSTLFPHIAWTEFGRAFRSLSSGTKRIIRRWIFGYLPTQQRLARHQQCASPLCPICKQTPETDEHFLICGGRDSWTISLFDPLERLFHKHNVPHAMTKVLLSLLQQYIRGLPIVNTLQPEVRFFSVFSGIFPIAWIDTYNQSTNSTLGSSTLVRIIKVIFSAVTTRWRTRCHSVHHHQQQIPEIRARLQHQIRVLYSCQASVLQNDKPIFSIPLNQRLQHSNSALKMFINQYRDIIKRSVRLHKEQLQRQHRDIATYFIRDTKPRGSL